MSTDQWLMFEKSSFNCFSISLSFFLWKTGHLSSAYKNRLHFIAIGISSTLIKNSKGPNMDPCDILRNMPKISEKELSEFTEKLRFDRYDRNHLTV